MTNKTIGNRRKVAGYYFSLQKEKSSKNNLQFYLDIFNHQDYYIYKSTNRFKEVSYDDLLEFKYAGYIFFKKDMYSKEWIDIWIEFLSDVKTISFYYLVKPFPPFNPEDKIKIKR